MARAEEKSDENRNSLECLRTGISRAQAAVTDFSGGGHFGSYYGSVDGDVIGFRSTADVDMLVTDLGIYDDSGNDGVLDSAHQVGIWRNSDMALMGSASIDSSGAAIGTFFLNSITPTPPAWALICLSASASDYPD